MNVQEFTKHRACALALITFGCGQQKPAEASGNEIGFCLKIHGVPWNPSGEMHLAS